MLGCVVALPAPGTAVTFFATVRGSQPEASANSEDARDERTEWKEQWSPHNMHQIATESGPVSGLFHKVCIFYY